jgi:4-hydroxybenzoate polyprenyltransferase
VVFVFVVSRECLMGVPDVDGDRRSGYRTVAATFGERSAYWAFRVGLVAFVGLLVLPIVVGSPGVAYGMAVACFAVVPAALAIVRLGWEPDPAGVASALHTTGLVFGGGLVPLFLLIGG